MITPAREKQFNTSRRLIGSKCGKCGEVYFPKRIICPSCRSDSVDKVEDTLPAEYGKLITWSEVNAAPSGFQSKTPYVVGLVEFDNGIRVEGLWECEIKDVKIGMDIYVGFGKIARDGEKGLMKHAYIFRPVYDRLIPEKSCQIAYDEDKTGIVGYGIFIPRHRIDIDDIAKAWGKDGRSVKNGLKVNEKAVAGFFDDSASMAVEAAKNAIRMSGIDPKDIGAVYVGSESPPYDVKSTAAIVADAIGATPNIFAADLEFACKAGMDCLNICKDYVDSGKGDYALAIGSDTAQGKPGDALEYTAASGAVAFIIGKKNPIAIIDETVSYVTDTPDFWRRSKANYPEHAGRFSGEPAYFKHIIGSVNELLKRTGMTLKDFDNCVFHQPNGKFPRIVAKKLGIPMEFFEQKVEPGMVVDKIGNTYSACSLIGLARILDLAEPGEKTIVASYGSGAGSLTISLTHVSNRRTHPSFDQQVVRKDMIDYVMYMRMRGKILK